MAWPLPWNSDASQTLLMTYLAKRRAEIAPGVGAHTDLVTIGPGPFSLNTVIAEAQAELPKLYARFLREEKRTAMNAAKRMGEFGVHLAEAKASKAVQTA